MPNIGKIEKREITREMEESYLDYAMSVIISRALPDVRDGLKPVHRRILYAMHQMGLNSKAKFRKSATVVGETMGKYHPHGDSALYDSLARMAQDFSMRYPLIDGQGNFGCFTKDTKVQLCDGRTLSFGALVKEQRQGKRHWTFSFNSITKKIEIAEIKNPRLTKRNADLVEVILDNGSKIKCTPSHLFMLRDGAYEEAQSLQLGRSLMPFYQKISGETDKLNRTGYVLVYQPKTNQWTPSHHLADNYNLFVGGYKKSKGRIRHHIDFDKTNNNPDNITRMHWGEHWRIHCEQAASQHQKADYREKIAAGRERFWSNPKNRARYSAQLSLRNKINWANPNYREKMCAILSQVNKAYIQNHPERRKEISEQMTRTLKRLWQTLEYRTLMHQKIVKANKGRITNQTGRKKFLFICKKALEQNSYLNEEVYSKTRSFVYPYGRAPLWPTGLKYFQNNPELVLHEICKNHKVVSVRRLSTKEDVYDLTIEKSHNFCLAAGVFVHNSIDGDSPAAMRYTESRLKSIGETLLADIEKETVDFGPNYDGSRQEPLVLPSRIPQLLLNGSMGIAVGMATNIPSHNLREVLEAVILLINKPKAGIEDLMQFIQGPDFPTGGAIYDIQALIEAYTSGKGGIVVRGKTNLEKDKIIISEIPYQVNKASLVEQIAKLIKDKKLTDIKDMRDESDREGMRIVLELKKDAFPQKILNKLYNYSDLQKSFHFNVLALVDGVQPKILSLKDILEEFIKHRREIVVRRARFELKISQARLHILDGLQKALEHIDAVIKTIKQSADKGQAAQNLIKKFGLTKIQAEAILEIKLQTLASLERKKIEDELAEKRKLVEWLKNLLADPKKIDKVIIEELEEIKEKFGDERRTKVYKGKVAEFSEEDLVPNEKTIIALTKDGYIKRVNPRIYKVQRRGGRGLVGMATKAEDVVINFISCNTHDNLFFFTNTGKVFKLKAFEVPEGSRVARGRAIVNFLNLQSREDVSAFMALPQAKYLIMATRNGIIKKTKLEEFENIRGSGLIAIKLKKNDELKWVKTVQDNDEMILITSLGQAIRFKETDIRPIGRTAAGVIGIRLNKDDSVVAMDVINYKLQITNYKLLTITENGYGKRTDLKFYKIQKRGGKGIKAMKINNKNGKLVSALILDETIEDLIVISQKGQIIRMKIKEISQMGRTTQGVRIMKLNNDRVSKSTTIN